MVQDSTRNMPQIKAGQIPEILLDNTEHGIVIGLMGPPGIGKTEAALQAADKLAKRAHAAGKLADGYKVVLDPTFDDWAAKDEQGRHKNFCVKFVFTSIIDELDVNGLPKVQNTTIGDRTMFILSSLIPTTGVGIVFFDEFGNGTDKVLSAFQHVLKEHKLCDTVISPDIHFVIATNRPEDGCHVSNISQAIRDRVSWFEVVPETNYTKLAEIMKGLNRPIHMPFVAFLENVGTKFKYNFNPKKDQYSFCSNRKLEMASRLMATIEDKKKLEKYVGGLLGVDFAAEFFEWVRRSEKVDFTDLYANPKKINKFVDDLPLLYSVCTAIVEHTKDKNTFDETAGVLLALESKEYGVYVIKCLVDKLGEQKFIQMLMKDAKGKETAYGKKIITAYRDVLNATE